MAYVPVTINGVAYPKNKKDPPMPVTIVGYAWVTGLSVGGGPVIPPEQLPPPGSGGFPHPDHTLPGDLPSPSHPIVLPPVDVPPPEIPTDPSVPKPPPADGGWGWSPVYGWGYFPGSGGAQPHRR
jgi:hypothetical protein